MSLNRRRRRKKQHRRHDDARRGLRTPSTDGAGDRDGGWFLPERLFAQRAIQRSPGAPQDASFDAESALAAAPAVGPPTGLQTAKQIKRLAYTRRQAAEALGVSLSTIDRQIVPAIETIKLPWGQRLIPTDELEGLLSRHREPAPSRPVSRRAGRPAALPRSVVERIRLEYARGRGLSEIARALTAEGIPTAHGGRMWWPSTVRAVLTRADHKTA